MKFILLALLIAASSAAQQPISFATQDGGLIFADVYGGGTRGVALAHGGQFHKESWKKQALVLERLDSEWWRSTSAALGNRLVRNRATSTVRLSIWMY